MKPRVLISALVFLVAILIVAISSYSFSRLDVSAKFTFKQHVIPEGTSLIGICNSYSAGALSGICSSSGTLDSSAQLIEFHLSENQLNVVSEDSLQQDQFGWPLLFFGDHKILYKCRDFSETAILSDPRINTKFLLRNSDNTVSDVTPSNLTETQEWNCQGGPPVLWSDKHGLSLFVYNISTRKVTLWQGIEQVTELVSTLPVIALGDMYFNGYYTIVQLCDDGKVYYYNRGTGTIEVSGMHSSLGIIAAKILKNPNSPPHRFALSNTMIVFKNKVDGEAVYTIARADGTRQDVKRVTNLDEVILNLPVFRGVKKMTDAEAQAYWDELNAAERKQLVQRILEGDRREIGPMLDPSVVSTASFILPIDEQSLGIFDSNLQRLTVISE